MVSDTDPPFDKQIISFNPPRSANWVIIKVPYYIMSLQFKVFVDSLSLDIAVCMLV